MTSLHPMKFCNGVRAAGVFSGAFRPDPLQRLAKILGAQGACQVTPAEGAADPPDLQSPKDKGDQTQLEVSPVQVLHQTAC
jgi:hypothetical protein